LRLAHRASPATKVSEATSQTAPRMQATESIIAHTAGAVPIVIPGRNCPKPSQSVQNQGASHFLNPGREWESGWIESVRKPFYAPPKMLSSPNGYSIGRKRMAQPPPGASVTGRTDVRETF
jgi:hypothetical protein